MISTQNIARGPVPRRASVAVTLGGVGTSNEVLVEGGQQTSDTGPAFPYVYARETKADADTAKVLTMDEARRVAQQYRQTADAAPVGRRMRSISIRD